MIRLASRSVAIVAAGSALALAGGLVPAQAATSGWRIDSTVGIRGNSTAFFGVSASSPSDAWATGFTLPNKGTPQPQPVIRRWTGKAWRTVTLPAKVGRTWARISPIDSPVAAVSARSAWVFGSLNGSYLRLNGSTWSIGRLPGAGSASSGTLTFIDAVKVFNGSNMWAFGMRDLASGPPKPYAVHYNGHRWSTVSVPGSGAITAVAALSSGNMWAVESAQSNVGPLASAAANSPAARPAAARLRAAASAGTAPVVLRWQNSKWQDAQVQPNLAASDELVSAVAEPGHHVWFGGSAGNSAKGTSPLTAEWNGTRWSVSDLPGNASSADLQLGAMTPDGNGGIWALSVNGTSGVERIWHHGATWSQVTPAFGKHQWILESLALVPRTHSVWGVGAVRAGKSSANGLIAVDGALPR